MYEKIKNFDGKKIRIRLLAGADFQNAKKFLNFINSLIEEKAKIMLNEKKED